MRRSAKVEYRGATTTNKRSRFGIAAEVGGDAEALIGIALGECVDEFETVVLAAHSDVAFYHFRRWAAPGGKSVTKKLSYFVDCILLLRSAPDKFQQHGSQLLP